MDPRIVHRSKAKQFVEMARSIAIVALLVFSLFSHDAGASASSAGASASSEVGTRFQLTHIDSKANYTKMELIRRAAGRSKRRSAARPAMPTSPAAASENNGIQAPLHYSEGEYLMDMSIGTPGVPISVIADTGSDLIWTQCEPCIGCFPQPLPIYDPAKSSTFSALSCNSSLCQALGNFTCIPDCYYLYSYGGGTVTRGILGTETFTIGTENGASFANIGFGCSDRNTGPAPSNGSGIVGLGRGPLSLVSQLGVGKFSFCFTPIGSSNSSTLFLGEHIGLNDNRGPAVPSTPLLINPNFSYYYISLLGLTVGDTRLPIPQESLQLQKNGTGGLIVDSGTTITQLAGVAFDVMAEEFASRLKLPAYNGSAFNLDLCFSLPPNSTVEVPQLIFHFDGGVDFIMPWKNYVAYDTEERILCVMINRSKYLSILGNYQQQDFLVIYDLIAERLSFVPSRCDQI